MTLNHEFVLREVAGETLLVPVGSATLSLNGMLVLNGCGRFLWEQLPAAATEDELVDALLKEYGENNFDWKLNRAIKVQKAKKVKG